MVTLDSFENFIKVGDFVSVRVEEGVIYNGEYLGSDIMFERHILIGPLTTSLEEIKREVKNLKLEQEHVINFKTMLPINTIKSYALLWQKK